jgi:hypothetical protein
LVAQQYRPEQPQQREGGNSATRRVGLKGGLEIEIPVSVLRAALCAWIVILVGLLFTAVQPPDPPWPLAFVFALGILFGGWHLVGTWRPKS